MEWPLILVTLIGLYVLTACFVAYVAGHLVPFRQEPGGAFPFISILVAARNEEQTLSRCIDALLAQDYPADRFEVVIANDHSTDQTADVVSRYQTRDPRIRLLTVPEPEGKLRGKAHALHEAIARTSSPLLLMTDADCAPPPRWARHMVAYFSDPEIGMVCGVTLVQSDRMIGQIQALDWMYLMLFASAVAEVGFPITAMGNNMALRRTAYERTGGYPALPFSVTEDFTLFQAVHALPDQQARLLLDPDIQNRTLALPRMVDVFRQRKRWARGGLRAKPWVFGIYVALITTHVLLPLALVQLPLWALVGFLIKLVTDLILIRFGFRHFGRTMPIRAFPAFELYLFAYMVLVPIILIISPRIQWKGRTY
jgi:cellulose synthase/poly-beta-1,6-N-acetylglucosamine synthase-like glycosyltransferase